MRALGLRATELGPAGYLGTDVPTIRGCLRAAGLRALGGFQPVALVEGRGVDLALTRVDAAAKLLQQLGCSYFVTAVVVDEDWSAPHPLDDLEWRRLIEGLDAVERICEKRGLVQVVHPHVGTLIETASDVERLVASSNVRWCLDTGHLAIGGTDPVEFARRHGDRVGLVHLKDVRLAAAPDLLARRTTLLEAVRRGLFCSLGEGDVDVRGVVAALLDRQYRGWYVFEQDTTIDAGEPVHDLAGPVGRSLDYLLSVVV